MINQLNLYPSPQHQPFTLTSTNPTNHTAVLLIHGFLGTPAECLPLAQHIHQTFNYTCHAPLLPGFGSDIATLHHRTISDWQATITTAYHQLNQTHQHIWLIGYSLGGALALTTTPLLNQNPLFKPVHGLILISPMLKIALETPFNLALWHLSKYLISLTRPLNRINFNDPRFRQEMTTIFPTLDLDDPHVQTALRQLPFPRRLIDQILRLGRLARHQLPRIKTPTFILQGDRDPIIPPTYLRHHVPTTVHYQEIPVNHDILDPDRPHWPALLHEINDYLTLPLSSSTQP
ncbi:MAG TPA: alpha/beta fold hydrolase [Anaerolineae bacterium]|nr:alpha/beta fold hydrolase [Anaerolineae bacterium]